MALSVMSTLPLVMRAQPLEKIHIKGSQISTISTDSLTMARPNKIVPQFLLWVN